MREQPTRAPSGYWPEIAAVLAAKAVALTVLYLLFFAAPAGVATPSDHLFQPGGATQGNRR